MTTDNDWLAVIARYPVKLEDAHKFEMCDEGYQNYLYQCKRCKFVMISAFTRSQLDWFVRNNLAMYRCWGL